MLAGFLGFASLAVTASANAIDIQDERKVRERGFDLIYEARELDLPQAVRDGLVQVTTPPLPSATLMSLTSPPGSKSEHRPKGGHMHYPSSSLGKLVMGL